MSRVWRSVKLEPSVTMNWSVSLLVLSFVGKYTSESTPSATVNQTFDRRLRAVPTQSLRARSKCESAPGPSGAGPLGGWAPALATAAATPSAIAKVTSIQRRDIVLPPDANEPLSVLGQLSGPYRYAPTGCHAVFSSVTASSRVRASPVASP